MLNRKTSTSLKPSEGKLVGRCRKSRPEDRQDTGSTCVQQCCSRSRVGGSHISTADPAPCLRFASVFWHVSGVACYAYHSQLLTRSRVLSLSLQTHLASAAPARSNTDCPPTGMGDTGQYPTCPSACVSNSVYTTSCKHNAHTLGTDRARLEVCDSSRRHQPRRRRCQIFCCLRASGR